MKALNGLVVALSLTCAAALGCAASTGATSHEDPTTISPACQLRQDMRELWTDHTVWTRDYVIAAVSDAPDQQAAANRLLKNQEDIGAAVATYYGKAAGDQLTSLLKTHITTAVDVVKAAKAGDKAAFKTADDAWQQNAMDIADFLSKANPNWPKATLVSLMKEHLSTTTTEVQARLDKNWDADVQAWDAVYDHILKMSDAIADGIVKQYPDKFRGQ